MNSTSALALAFDQLSDMTSGNDFVVQTEAQLVAELGGTISDFINLDNQKDKTQQVSA
ncbi:hypothetical protein ACXZ7F_01405 [Vibrio harveyi]